MNWYQNILAKAFLAFLQGTLKNPKALIKERSLLTQIRDMLNDLLAQIPG